MGVTKATTAVHSPPKSIAEKCSPAMAKTFPPQGIKWAFTMLELLQMEPNLIHRAIAVCQLYRKLADLRQTIWDDNRSWESYQGMGWRCSSNESWRESEIDYYSVCFPLLSRLSWTELIFSDYGYGVRGYPPVIPPSSTLIFDVELLAINRKTA